MADKEYTLTESGTYTVVASDSSGTYSDSNPSNAINFTLPKKVLKVNNIICGKLNNKYIAKVNNTEVMCGKVVPNYLCFTASVVPISVELIRIGSPSIANTAYSTNGADWVTYNPSDVQGTNPISLNPGEKVYFRNDIIGDFDRSNHLQFTFNGHHIVVSGNINSIYDSINFETLDTLTYKYCYYELFVYSMIISAPVLMPAKILSDGCYEKMFYSNYIIETIPELPATTLAPYCYAGMFAGCGSLEKTPELPATTLAPHCYGDMFSECFYLTTITRLPATTLATMCYYSMFSWCGSLETLPELPATTLAAQCYDSMFYGCSNIKVSQTQIDEYQTAYRIPTSGSITGSWFFDGMFSETGGPYAEGGMPNTTYYTANTVI